MWGCVFQDFALFPHLNVIDNVSFGLNALSRREAARVAEHALERVGLASFRHSYPSSLSGGERQRVALARAIVPRPQSDADGSAVFRVRPALARNGARRDLGSCSRKREQPACWSPMIRSKPWILQIVFFS